MTVAATSREAYHDIQVDGTTATQQLRIIAALRDVGSGMTRKELSVRLGIDPGSVAGRVDELIRCGRLIDGPARKCSITGRRAKGVHLA